MLSRLSGCVFKRALFLRGTRPFLPRTFPSYVSVYKCFGTRAVRFASQSPLDHLSTASHTHGELGLRNEDHVPSKIPTPSFHVVFLRDSCSCNRCIDPSTSQRLFETADIPDNIQGYISRRNSDGSVTVAWQNDIPGYENHRSTYTSHFITSSLTCLSRSSALYNRKQQPVLWDRNTMTNHSTPTDYKTFIGSSTTLYRALIALQKFGIIFLCNVPPQSDAINHISNRIGLIRKTIYGSTWDVRSVPSAKNIAYTATRLGFHMVRRSSRILFQSWLSITISFRTCFIWRILQNCKSCTV